MGTPGSAPVRSTPAPRPAPAGANRLMIGLGLAAVLGLGIAGTLWFTRAPAPVDAPAATEAAAAAATPNTAETQAPAPAQAAAEPAPEQPAPVAPPPTVVYVPTPAPAAASVPALPARHDVAFFAGTWCQPYNGLTIVYEVIRTGADTVLTRVDHPQAQPWDVASRIVPVAGGFEMQPVDEPVAADNTARFEIVDDRMMKLVFANGAAEDGSILRMRCDGRKD
jgi:hypothetical protein